MKEGMATTKKQAVAILVRKAREERAWTQTQLAKVAAVNLRTIQRLEKDGSASFETLMGVAQALDIEIQRLTSPSKPKEVDPARKKVHLMPRIVSGKDLTNIVVGADLIQFAHDDDQDPRSISAMKDILGLLQQDVIRLHDADAIKRLEVESEMSQEIVGLEAFGYYLFGIKRVIPRIAEEQRTLVSMATLYMSHARSPKIVKDKAFMILPAALPEVAS